MNLGAVADAIDDSENGRGDWIRTNDPLLPKQVRYQTALRPEFTVSERRHGGCDSIQCAAGARGNRICGLLEFSRVSRPDVKGSLIAATLIRERMTGKAAMPPTRKTPKPPGRDILVRAFVHTRWRCEDLWIKDKH